MHTEAMEWLPRWMTHPLIRAFAISLLLHLAFFTTLEVGNRFDLWRFSPLVLLAKMLNLDLSPSLTAERTTSRAIALAQQQPEEEQVIPIQFVDVDPTQATSESPEKTKYYSAVNSLAANRNTSRDTDTPELDGRQDRVFKTMDTERAKPPQPMQPAPVAPQQPQAGVSPEVVKPQPVSAAPAPPKPEPPPPAPPPAPEVRSGETLIAKATPVVAPAVSVQVATPPESASPTRTRPRTVAAALAQRQINPNSAVVGEKMKQDGGVKRFSIASSLNVQGSPLGNYDAKFIAAVQQCWFGLLEEQRYSLDRVGKVIIDFRLTSDGRITDLKTAQSDVGEIYTTICELAIRKPAPYEKWPNDVRKMVGGNYRDVRFTFYY
jgi:hypothetical protein